MSSKVLRSESSRCRLPESRNPAFDTWSPGRRQCSRMTGKRKSHKYIDFPCFGNNFLRDLYDCVVVTYVQLLHSDVGVSEPVHGLEVTRGCIDLASSSRKLFTSGNPIQVRQRPSLNMARGELALSRIGHFKLKFHSQVKANPTPRAPSDQYDRRCHLIVGYSQCTRSG